MSRAVALFSGSLASIVAAKLILQEPGIEGVKFLSFRSPFFRDYERTKELANRLFNCSFRSRGLKLDFIELASIQGKGGYELRSCCFKCRKQLLQRAMRYMKKFGADFVISGEIVGKRGLGVEEILQLDKEAGAYDRVLRPLSAKLLPPTLPERQQWVNRRHLPGLTAEDSAGLIQLAQKLGIEVDGFPAEQRCKLILPGFSQRLEDLLREEHPTLNGLELLEFPLYYKKPPDVKIVLGRNEEEKRRLQNFFLPGDLRLYVPVGNGPIALVRANWESKSEREILEIIELAARITAMHADLGVRRYVPANYRFESSQQTHRINIFPFSCEQELEQYCVRLAL